MADLARLHDRDEFSEWFKKKMPVIDCDPELILIAKTWAREAWDARQSEVDKLKHEMHMAVECGRVFEKERDALQARVDKLRDASRKSILYACDDCLLDLGCGCTCRTAIEAILSSALAEDDAFMKNEVKHE